MYVCGPTVYDLPHIGHGRAALVYDLLRRYLEWRGHEVRHVSNVTDIDDKIIARAQEEGSDTTQVVERYEAAWHEALEALDVKLPTEEPHATDYVEQMVELVTRLVERDAAYETSDGVYFSVDAVEGYGLLARQSLESLRRGARVEVTGEKRSPLDFALWKKAKEGEPAWPSPWGPGRPGWHTECVAMSLDLLGDGFDLHAGGLDLMFPHHENERAQAVALGHRFARHWMHHAFVEVGGEKMSKSLRNFTTLDELLHAADGRAYRLLVARSHYRSPIEVTRGTVAEAEKNLDRLDELARRVASLPGVEADRHALERFVDRMDDDLDTAAVVADLFELVRRTNTALDAGEPEAAAPLAAAVEEICGVLGLRLAPASDEVDDTVRDLLARREAARATRDFAAADAIRDELQSKGWVLEDTPQGPRVHR
jgi:cysteinyl-tRNA synthetase